MVDGVRDRAAGLLRDWLRAGRWPQGERLPSELDLAHRLGVARGTVRRVLEQLVVEGLLEPMPGRGLRVRTRTASAGPSPGPGSIALISLSLHGWPDGNHDLHGGRSLVACDHAAAEALAAAGRLARVINLDDLAHTDARSLLAHAAGIAVCLTAGSDPRTRVLLAAASALGLPGAMAGSGPEAAPWDGVAHDHAAGARNILQWLHGQGHRRIVELGTCPGNWWVEARHNGYSKAMVDARLVPLNRIHARLSDDAPFEVRARQMVGFVLEAQRERRATALMLTTDWDLALVAGACRHAGLEPNRDLALAGYDDNWDNIYFERVPVRPLVTLNQDWPDMGVQLATQAMERVDGRLPPSPQLRWLPGRLVQPEPADG